MASRLAVGKGRHAYIPIKMVSGVQDITCVFVEVAGSYEKKTLILQWCVVHQWCQNVLVRLTGGWTLFTLFTLHYITLHYITLHYITLILFFFHTVGKKKIKNKSKYFWHIVFGEYKREIKMNLV